MAWDGGEEEATGTLMTWHGGERAVAGQVTAVSELKLPWPWPGKQVRARPAGRLPCRERQPSFQVVVSTIESMSPPARFPPCSLSSLCFGARSPCSYAYAPTIRWAQRGTDRAHRHLPRHRHFDASFWPKLGLPWPYHRISAAASIGGHMAQIWRRLSGALTVQTVLDSASVALPRGSRHS